MTTPTERAPRYRATCRNLDDLGQLLDLIESDPTAADAEPVTVYGRRGEDTMPLGEWRSALETIRAGRGNPTNWGKRPSKGSTDGA